MAKGKKVLTLTNTPPFVKLIGPEKKKQPARIEIQLAEYKAYGRGRGLAWEISDDLARHVMRSACNYCGRPTSLELNGIGLVEESHGFIEKNVVSICKFCMRAKWTFTAEEFRGWLKGLRTNWRRAVFLHKKPGRPKVWRECEMCARWMSARDMWRHLTACRRAHDAAVKVLRS